MANFVTIHDGGVFNATGHNPVAVRLVAVDGGVPYLDVRKMWRTSEGVLAPTREGVTIKATEMVAFVNALAKCVEAAGVGKREGAPAKAKPKAKAKK